MALMLRRYDLTPGTAEAFARWWSAHIPALRAAAGFTVEWAYLDRENETFTWALTYPGDVAAFHAADETYRARPERAEAMQDAPPLRAMSVGFPENIL